MLVRQTPVTCAPNAFAIWTAKGPTFPDAPLTRTLSPGSMRLLPRRFCNARMPDCGTVAASSKLMLGGLWAHACSAAQAYSAKAP